MLLLKQLKTAALCLLGLGIAACSAGADSAEPTQNTADNGGVQVFASGLVTPEPTPTLIPATLVPDFGPAPEIENEVWINSDTPLPLASLRGKVVLIEFWTFGCINCQHVLPWLDEWYEKYNGDDFTIVSVHYPEFNYEEDVDNVRDATVRLGVDYPVAIDNDGKTWRAYEQHYWPTRYLVDKNGNIRYKHIGEGAYAETEALIQTLMTEPEPIPQ
ncbi:MAG: thioredoxin-like domain-containing protein [Candidatus Promineifilaceae bacterium]